MTNKCNSVGRHLCLEATFWLSSQSLGESVVDVVKILCRLPSPPPHPPPPPWKASPKLGNGADTDFSPRSLLLFLFVCWKQWQRKVKDNPGFFLRKWEQCNDVTYFVGLL